MKVALIGQGPDELFGGYKRHLGVRYGQVAGAACRRRCAALIGAAVNRLPRNETAQAWRATRSALRTG